MQEILIDIMNNFGYLGIGFLIFIENIFPPIPSEVILLFGGFMTTYSDMNVWLVILSSTVGAYAGACALYGIGRALNKDRLIKIVNGKTGKILRLKAEHIEKADKWFTGKGYGAVFICRCVPVVRSLISIPAGMSKMPFLSFSLLTILGSAVWNTVLTWTGRFSGTAWDKYAGYFDTYSNVVIFLIIAAIIIGVAAYIIKRKISSGVIKINKPLLITVSTLILLAVIIFSVVIAMNAA